MQLIRDAANPAEPAPRLARRHRRRPGSLAEATAATAARTANAGKALELGTRCQGARQRRPFRARNAGGMVRAWLPHARHPSRACKPLRLDSTLDEEEQHPNRHRARFRRHHALTQREELQPSTLRSSVVDPQGSPRPSAWRRRGSAPFSSRSQTTRACGWANTWPPAGKAMLAALGAGDLAADAGACGIARRPLRVGAPRPADKDYVFDPHGEGLNLARPHFRPHSGSAAAVAEPTCARRPSWPTCRTPLGYGACRLHRSRRDGESPRACRRRDRPGGIRGEATGGPAGRL